MPGSRGCDANTFYVVCRHAPDHHDPERIDSTPAAVLTDILTRPVDAILIKITQWPSHVTTPR